MPFDYLTFRVFVLWIHIAAFALWVGGMFAVSFACVPVLRSGGEAAGRVIANVLQRFQRMSREIVFLVFLTGLFNLINAGMERRFNYGPEYLGIFAVKFVLFVAMISIQLWQSQRLAPRLAAADSTAAGALQRRFVVTSLVNLVLAVTAILLGLRLRYG